LDVIEELRFPGCEVDRIKFWNAPSQDTLVFTHEHSFPSRGTSFCRGRQGFSLVRDRQNGFNNFAVSCAPTQVTADRYFHLLFGRVRAQVQEGFGGHHHPGGAKPALNGAVLNESFLKRMQFPTGPQSFDGQNLASIHFHGQDET
jgi:hypothetical protein